MPIYPLDSSSIAYLICCVWFVRCICLFVAFDYFKFAVDRISGMSYIFVCTWGGGVSVGGQRYGKTDQYREEFVVVVFLTDIRIDSPKRLSFKMHHELFSIFLLKRRIRKYKSREWISLRVLNGRDFMRLMNQMAASDMKLHILTSASHLECSGQPSSI